MKIQFKDLDYQEVAIQSIIRVFEGQHIRKSEFTIMDQDIQGKLFGEKGIGNKIDLSESKLIQNVQQIQIEQGIPISESIPLPIPQFNIEMETGTGKTFVYLKSILELNKKYGFTKFIIVVPSVAIKEGVMKTIEQTREYFKSQMHGIVYRAFMYDSKKLDNIQGFARNENVEIMIINIQSFNSDDKIFNREDLEDLNGISPKQLVSETNPIVIIDEPQSVDNTENAKQAIAALNPSIVFRFSATHKNKNYPLLYKLGPVEAYQQKLVKQIEVAGIKKSIDANEAYIKLIGIKATKKSITATVEMYVKNKTQIEKKEVKLKKDDDLYIKSKRIAAYEKVGFVKDISAEPGNEYIEFSGEPSIIRLSQAIQNDLQIKRAQIRKTIEEHLNKELKLNPLGIKVLSLFFIDNVANYRQYDGDNNRIPGPYAKIFEEEYEDVIRSEKYKSLRDRHVPVSEVHDGYFSVDGKGKFKNTSGSTQADESTYQIIMKDKEDLLTFYDEEKGNVKKAHKLRFIFSHSALKEGWDNPNVFQICTLIETKDTITKRQKIGRGLRIAVNQEGERVPGFEVNTLTIMANESYEEFASGLQKEYEDEGVKFGVFEDDIFSSLVVDVDPETGYKTPLGHQKSRELIQYLKDHKYLDDKNKGTEALAKAIKEDTFDIPESIKEIADDMKEKIVEAIKEKFNVDKIEIKDKDNAVKVRLNKEVLAGPFLELWERIKYKTKYSIQFDSESFIKQAADKLSEELEVRITRLEYERHRLETTGSGIEAIKEEQTTFAVSEKQYEKAPDILTYLQNETKLTRKTIIAILKQSDTLRDFRRNPQVYMMEAARIINAAKRLAIVDGIKYEKLSNEEVYEQSLFIEEIDSYEDSIVPVHSERSLYDYVIVDSSVEREFAESCERDPNVKFYIKLPRKFTIKTPLGSYNPDWALSLEQDGKEKLYFIVETKGSTASEDLRPTELAKIRCGEKHFEAIDTGIRFKRATKQQAIYS
jgi:type III restriction enzyme